jgi:hypothetical protein
MPLATEFKWRQTDAELLLDVALKSASISGKDVDICDVFVKVNQSPHLLALDLFAAVDLATAVVTIDRAVKRILITLRKAVAATWPDVVAVRADGESVAAFEAQLVARRNESLARRSAHDQKVRETTAAVQRDREKAALRSQMDVEQKQRDTLEAAQDLEKRRAQVRARTARANGWFGFFLLTPPISQIHIFHAGRGLHCVQCAERVGRCERSTQRSSARRGSVEGSAGRAPEAHARAATTSP